MKKLALTLIFLTLLLSTLAVPVHASVSVETTIRDTLNIIYSFENLDPTTYDETVANPQFNTSTIPQLIVKNLEKRGLINVNKGFETITYDNATKTIRALFSLSGSDIISLKLNRTTMRRNYEVITEWRKIQVNLTSSFSVDFAQRFSEPVANWQKTSREDDEGRSHPAFHYETADTNSLGSLSFYFILPENAINVQAQEDTITFEVPPYFEDILLNSPFLPLAVLIIVIAIVLVYRKIK